MKKFDLQLFDESRAALLRNAIADYAEIDGAFELMGTGFTTLDESPNAQTDSETYINEVTASTDITSYETEFAYESRLIPSQKAIYKLWKMGRDHATGSAALPNTPPASLPWPTRSAKTPAPAARKSASPAPCTPSAIPFWVSSTPWPRSSPPATSRASTTPQQLRLSPKQRSNWLRTTGLIRQ